ncbi:unnamed protein product [Cylindrotheca closterium]|uniref:Transmembrane protein n=1 Tax=Cylindrotheca closterium TaxID=2856 RepID=A0AAD2GBF2_9STRA|nr:unnamed protein product [Cylindrotheca closterium]CAJ1967475.1 unnamed protein product [Cylindrotheca closterium]
MMTSMWQRWTTTPSSSDDFLLEEGAAAEERDEHDEHDDLPKQVHVGLSIDSSHKSETSSLSDFEEGMPLWARDNTPPRSNLRTLNGGEDGNNIDDDDDDGQDEPPNHRPHVPLNLEIDPIGFQIPIPQRWPISLDSPHTSTLTQRSKTSTIPCSLPTLPMNGSQLRGPDDDAVAKMDPFQMQNKKAVSGKKLMRMVFAVLAIGLMAVSVHQQRALPELWWEREQGGAKLRRHNLPTFTTQQRKAQPQLATFDTNNHQVPQRRSNLAFARASSQLPVFETQSDDELFTDISNSSPFVSFLGGCAFVAILLETGWKGYQKSKLQRNQTQAIRRLYKQTN